MASRWRSTPRPGSWVRPQWLTGTLAGLLDTAHRLGDAGDVNPELRPARWLRTTVRTEISQAARRSVAEHVDQLPFIFEGWTRSVSGARTCPACLGLANGVVLPASTPMAIHPGCDCMPVPVTRIARDGPMPVTGTEIVDNLDDEQRDAYGPYAEHLGDLDSLRGWIGPWITTRKPGAAA